MTLVPPGSLRFPNGAEATGFCAADHFDAKEAAFVDRFTQFAVVAAREALAGHKLPPETSAIVMGTSAGGQTTEPAS